MYTRIYFVRHAEPDFSIRDDMTRPLTEKGTADARKVTAVLLDKGISAVYSSPFKRAVDTVRDFAERSGLNIITNDSFCERIAGEWVEDYKSYSKRQWEDFDYKLTGGESLRAAQKRNIEALHYVIKENEGKNVAVGTHGTALSTIMNYFNPAFGHDDFWRIIDRMPYILCLSFNGLELAAAEEIEI